MRSAFRLVLPNPVPRLRLRTTAITAAIALLTALLATAGASAQTLTVLYSFTGYADGYPPSAVIRDTAGNLYGTTFYGGTPGNGTVFKLDATGNKTVLHAFTATHGDGRSPAAGLVLNGGGFLRHYHRRGNVLQRNRVQVG